jgi:hypothetical protein
LRIYIKSGYTPHHLHPGLFKCDRGIILPPVKEFLDRLGEGGMTTTIDTTDITTFTEVFPVRTTALPRLHAYQLVVGGGDSSSIIGGKLSYRLRRVLGGHWVWTSDRVVADIEPSSNEVMEVVQDLWQEQPDTFKDLRSVRRDSNWRTTPQSQADFVARGLFEDIRAEVQQSLAEKAQDLGNVVVERVCEPRGWVVNNQPAISISISSHLIHKQDLRSYASHLDSPQDLVGLSVADKTSTLKGEIIAIAGHVRDHRTRLLAITQREEMQDLIGQAPDSELVVGLLSGRNEYDYVLSALRIIVRTEDYPRFNVNPRQASNVLHIDPSRRAEHVTGALRVSYEEEISCPLVARCL